MRRLFILALLLATTHSLPRTSNGQIGANWRRDELTLAQRAHNTLLEVTTEPRNGLAPSLLRNAQAVVIIPRMFKAGFILGVEHGRGVLLVRDRAGRWSFPVFVKLTGGNFGALVGAQSSELIFVFNTKAGVAKLVEGRGRVTLGAGAEASAGPVGRGVGAGTDLSLDAEILTYARGKGLYAGAAIGGGSLRVDREGNVLFYDDAGISPAQIIRGEDLEVPMVGAKLRDYLNKLGEPAMQVDRRKASRGRGPATVINGDIMPEDAPLDDAGDTQASQARTKSGSPVREASRSTDSKARPARGEAPASDDDPLGDEPKKGESNQKPKPKTKEKSESKPKRESEPDPFPFDDRAQ